MNGPMLVVADLELLPPHTLPPGSTIGEVAETLVRERVPALLLGDGAAIVTEHDIVRAVARGRSIGEPATVVATPDPIAVPRDASVIEAVEVMLRHGLRALVVVDARGRPCGMVTLVRAASALLSAIEVPSWLAGLRVALRVEMDR